MFSSSTSARTIQIRVELATSKKRDLFAADYFHKTKGLATAGSALRDDDVIAYLLTGLDLDYYPFVTLMTTKSEAIMLDDVFAHLMAFESRQLQHQAELQLNFGSSASYVGRGSQQKKRGHRDRGCGRSQGGTPSCLAGYLHDTIDMSLFLTKSNTNLLNAFSNADWAGNLDDRRSTRGYAIFFGGNLIS